MRTQFELSDIIRRFGSELSLQTKLTSLQLRVLDKIVSCRTATLGGHQEVCSSCGIIRYSYNSCGDRHCPKCQAVKQAFWIDDLMRNTLPVQHYHLVFTLPHQLNRICLYNQRLYYDLFFSAVWNTLRTFGYTHYGVESGAIAVLHTWGQNLTLHPHIHCIVPAAGYTLEGRWKNTGVSGKYLYPVHQLSDHFKGRFLNSLKRALHRQKVMDIFNEDIQKAWKTRWVVHSEPSLASADHVIKYLGQYTHRVAITNRRILNISGNKVTFIAKDYRSGGVQKPVTLSGVEFLRRFAMHILPGRFVKIRRYGIYHHTTKANLELQFSEQSGPSIESLIREKGRPESRRQRFERLSGIDMCRCRVCKEGRMIILKVLPRIRSPAPVYRDQLETYA